MRCLNKKGIALLLTMMFIIAITLSVGIGLKYTNNAKDSLKNENFLLQTSVILDDVLTILEKSKELDSVLKDKTGESLYIFLSQNQFIPIEYSNIRIGIEFSSARSKFNLNTLDALNVQALKQYISNYMVEPSYVDILLDGMSGVKEDASYNSDIFNEKPTLFRDYITSYEHLEEFNDFYTNKFYDNSLAKIKFDDIFNYSKDTNTSIDLNYASVEVWKLILGVSDEEAEQLALSGGSYTQEDPPKLSDEQNKILQNYKHSYYEPYIDVKLEIIQDKFSAKIAFEYDIKNRKGYNFHYEI